MQLKEYQILVDYRILFASEEEQIRFVRHGKSGLSGEAMKNVHQARKFILSRLAKSMGSMRFHEEFSSLSEHPLFAKSHLDLAESVLQVEHECRSSWGKDLKVALASPSNKSGGQLLFFNLNENIKWDLSCFHEGEVGIIEDQLNKRKFGLHKKYKLELAMAPFGFPDDSYQVAGCSWMLPLALACHNKERGVLTRGLTVFSACMNEDGALTVDSASAEAKWLLCQSFAIESLVLPHKTFSEKNVNQKIDHFSKALSLNESINIFNIEGKTDRQVVSGLRKSSVSQRDWKRTLPVARLFYQKLIAENLTESFPATFDYAQRLLASSLLHTGEAREAQILLREILAKLKDKDVSSYLHLDIFEHGDEWLRYAFDYFFTESTVLSQLGFVNEALEEIDERLKDLERTSESMKQSLGLLSSDRLDYSWVKGLFTKVICLLQHGLCLGESSSLQYAWELCQSPRYQQFFESFLGMPEEDLPAYMTVESVIRSFNYTVDVAFELNNLDLLADKDLESLNFKRQRILERWGEQPHDMFFALSCLKIDNMLKKIDATRKKHYQELFWNFRDSSFYSVADKFMERLKLHAER